VQPSASVLGANFLSAHVHLGAEPPHEAVRTCSSAMSAFNPMHRLQWFEWSSVQEASGARSVGQADFPVGGGAALVRWVFQMVHL
jgi:hypothetical protein